MAGNRSAPGGDAIEQLGSIATILAHPLCMEMADGMQRSSNSAGSCHDTKPYGSRR